MAELKIEMPEGSKVTEDTQKHEEAPKPQAKEEPRYVKLEDLEKVNQAINNTREYNNRQLAEIRAAIESLKPREPKSAPDDLDEVVQKDWKAGVKGVIDGVLKEYQQKAVVQTEEQRTFQILEESKRKVMEKHKELGDPNSEKTKEFLRVLDENPDFKSNPRGPILAAYEMENRLKSHDKMDSGVEKVKEARSRATAVPAGTSPGTRQGYSLSKSDLDFCRLNNINPENYKRYRGLKETQA